MMMTFAVGASFAMAPAVASAYRTGGRTSSECKPSALAPVFSWAWDANLYEALPGESWNSMGDGSGWTLSGGASFETATLLDGSSGSVLDLPSGSAAVSPTVCLTADYPMARAEIRNLAGQGGVNVYVSYPNAYRRTQPAFSANLSGQSAGWSLPRPFSIIRGNIRGWQLARFILVPQGQSSEYQISNFYVDPRMHH
jgi:hypothetical protein